ncbi:MAG: NAD(P)-dependent oxidoreductase [Paracoccaceae bacterium]
MKISFLGLGVMGFPMAGHLANSGHELTVYNRTVSKAMKWVESYNGNVAKTPKLASIDAEIVISCVGNDNDLRDITMLEDGAFHSMNRNSIFIDHSTVSASVSRELYNLATKREFEYLDAPISGGQAGAENAKLSIMCGGDEATFNKALPIMKSYSKICKLMGVSGSGQLTKMVNQICIAGLVQGLSEGLNFAQKAGLDVKDVVEVISEGAAGSWQMDNRHETMIQEKYDFGFAVDWMRKDLKICMEEADRNGAALPITSIIDQFYKEIQNSEGGRLDTSSLLKRLQEI